MPPNTLVNRRQIGPSSKTTMPQCPTPPQSREALATKVAPTIFLIHHQLLQITKEKKEKNPGVLEMRRKENMIWYL